MHKLSARSAHASLLMFTPTGAGERRNVAAGTRTASEELVPDWPYEETLHRISERQLGCCSVEPDIGFRLFPYTRGYKPVVVILITSKHSQEADSTSRSRVSVR